MAVSYTHLIVCLYQQGYSLADIKKAMKLSGELNIRPFELLEKKGKPKYSLREETAENAGVMSIQSSDGYDDADEPQQTEVMDKIEEKSWDSVIAETEGNEAPADADMQYIKDNNLLEFIDRSMLSEDELAYLTEQENNNERSAAVYASSSNDEHDEITETFNNKIFPQMQYKQYSAGMSQTNEEVEIRCV